MCSKKKAILVICLLAVLVAGMVWYYMACIRQSPEPECTFVKAMGQIKRRWGL